MDVSGAFLSHLSDLPVCYESPGVLGVSVAACCRPGHIQSGTAAWLRQGGTAVFSCRLGARLASIVAILDECGGLFLVESTLGNGLLQAFHKLPGKSVHGLLAGTTAGNVLSFPRR